MELKTRITTILANYTPENPSMACGELKSFWLEFTPNKGIDLLKAEDLERIEAAGTPIPDLKNIAKEINKNIKKDPMAYLPFAEKLWKHYGREGRVISLIMLGAMELKSPQIIVPLLKEYCRECVTWEDADRLAMDALEPIVRKDTDSWLDEMAAWMEDDNKWIKRAGVTVIARLPMKKSEYTGRVLEMTAVLLEDEDLDVKRAVSFSIRICAKFGIDETRKFLEKHVPPKNPVSTWVLCDAIRSMGKKNLPDYKNLAPLYEKWAQDPSVDKKERRSIESALKLLVQ